MFSNHVTNKDKCENGFFILYSYLENEYIILKMKTKYTIFLKQAWINIIWPNMNYKTEQQQQQQKKALFKAINSGNSMNFSRSHWEI